MWPLFILQFIEVLNTKKKFTNIIVSFSRLKLFSIIEDNLSEIEILFKIGPPRTIRLQR